MQLYVTSEYKNTTQYNTNRKKYGELANKVFSWALVRQVATCHFHACVYKRRSFNRIFNALVWGTEVSQWAPGNALVGSGDKSLRI